MGPAIDLGGRFIAIARQINLACAEKNASRFQTAKTAHIEHRFATMAAVAVVMTRISEVVATRFAYAIFR